jgi:YHS domain-containing protein
MNTTKTLLAALALSSAVFGAAVSPAFAVNELNTSPGLTTAGAPLALHGYDPVAYFTDAKPTLGNSKLVVANKGASYYFANQANLDMFKANPGKFEPQFGGYCAFGVSIGKKFDGDPNQWKIVDGKLYVNLNADIAEKFNADVPGALKKAEGNWPTIQDKAPTAL